MAKRLEFRKKLRSEPILRFPALTHLSMPRCYELTPSTSGWFLSLFPNITHFTERCILSTTSKTTLCHFEILRKLTHLEVYENTSTQKATVRHLFDACTSTQLRVIKMPALSLTKMMPFYGRYHKSMEYLDLSGYQPDISLLKQLPALRTLMFTVNFMFENTSKDIETCVDVYLKIVYELNTIATSCPLLEDLVIVYSNMLVITVPSYLCNRKLSALSHDQQYELTQQALTWMLGLRHLRTLKFEGCVTIHFLEQLLKHHTGLYKLHLQLHSIVRQREQESVSDEQACEQVEDVFLKSDNPSLYDVSIVNRYGLGPRERKMAMIARLRTRAVNRYRCQ